MPNWLIQISHRISLWHNKWCKCSKPRAQGKFNPEALRDLQGHPEYRQVLFLLEVRLRDRERDLKARRPDLPRDEIAAEARTIEELINILSPNIL